MYLSRRRATVLGACLVVLVLLGFACYPSLVMSRRVDSVRRALSRGDLTAALRLLGPLEARYPESAAVHYLLAVAHRRTGKLDQFRAHLQRAAELGWSEEDVQRQRWLAVAQTGNVQAMEGRVKELIERGAPDDVAEEMYEAVSKGHLALYRLHDAWKCLDIWLQWRPDAPSARSLRGDLYEKLGQRELAVEDYRAAVEQLPEDRDLRIKFGEALLHGQHVEEAYEQFRRCLEAVPDDVQALIRLAECARQLGQTAVARRCLDNALGQQLTPYQRAVALSEVGRLLLSENQVQEALGPLSEAAELAPAERLIHHSLATALARAGQPERAQYHHERVRQIRTDLDRLAEATRRIIDKPDDADLRCEVGAIFMAQGLKREGADWLTTALGCDPGHRKSHELLAQYYIEIGDQRRAAEHRLMAVTGVKRPRPAESK